MLSSSMCSRNEIKSAWLSCSLSLIDVAIVLACISAWANFNSVVERSTRWIVSAISNNLGYEMIGCEPAHNSICISQ